MKKLIEALAEISVEVKKVSFRVEAIEKIGGGELPDLISEICDPILDLLGVPADNTEIFRNKYGDEAFGMKGFFCRDAFLYEFGELPADKKKISEWLRKTMRKYGS